MINLSEEQLEIFKYLNENKNVFITGTAGSGKSTLIKYFVNYIKKCTTKQIAVTSTTGISALLINGSTIHSYFGLGLGINSFEHLYRKINKSKHKKRWLETNILIIDEISMMDKELFEKINLLAQKIRKNNLIFGGIQIILSGDFAQLPSINKQTFLFNTECWKNIIDKTFYLTKSFRQDDIHFINILNEIRFGKLSQQSILELKKRENVELQDNNQPTILYSLNQQVDYLNEHNLNILAEKYELYEFQMNLNINYKNLCLNINSSEFDDFMNDDLFKYIYNKFIKNLQIKPNINLCLDCNVMMLTNTYFNDNIVNGSQGKIIGFNDDNMPIVKFYNNQIKHIEPETFEIEEDDELFGYYTQIPLRLSYSSSIHKTQGATLDAVEIDFNGIFEYGQAYVAISRAKKLENIIIKNFNINKIRAHPDIVRYYQQFI